MIQEKHLTEFLAPKPLSAHAPATVAALDDALRTAADANQIPYACHTEDVRFGGMLKNHIDSCLVITHPEHQRDYFSLVISCTGEKLTVYRYGSSKQMDKLAEKASFKGSAGTFGNGLFGGHDVDDAVTGAAANIYGAGKMMKGTAGMLIHGLKALGGSKQKLEEEKAWYAAINKLLEAAVL